MNALERIWFPAPAVKRRKPALGPRLAATTLSPLARLFGLAVARRRRRTTVESLPVAVVVVGNLTVGGSGKTPLVIALVEALRLNGFTPGVVSRGYGGEAVRKKDAVAAVDGDDDEAAKAFGDEPVLVRRKTGAPVFVGRERVRAARALLAAHPDVDVLVADDGLQHYALPRNFEIAVFDGRGTGNGRLLPAGPLREPLGRLAEVDAVVLNGDDTTLPALPDDLALRAPPYRMRLEAGRAYRVNAPGDVRELPTFRGKRLTAVAGIANPQRFFATLKQFGLSFHRMPLADHYRFEDNPFESRTSEAVLMTEKDAVKCRHFDEDRMWAVPVTARIDQSLIEALLPRIVASRQLHGASGSQSAAPVAAAA